MNKLKLSKWKQVNQPVTWTALMAIASASMHPAMAVAADGLQEIDILEEVVVTAQKREENVQNVGISIAALGADQLQNMGITSTDQLAGMVPGVQIFQFGQQATTTISVRGVSQNDFADHNEAPVAVYQDGAYNSFIGGAGLALFDVDRVEILRGPQGTLFGRNATGGLVQLITRKPRQAFDAYAQITGAQFGMKQIEAAAGGGLTDTVAARIALQATQDDGTAKNVSGPRKQKTDNVSARLQFSFQPTDDLDILWKLHGVQDNVTGTVAYKTTRAITDSTTGLVRAPVDQTEYASFCTDLFNFSPSAGSPDCFDSTATDPNDPWTVASNFPGTMDRTMYGTTVTVDWNFLPDVTLTSITDYLKLDRNYTEDTDGTDNPFAIFNFQSDMHSHQVSQELRLNGQTDLMKWQTGIYYLDIEHDIDTGIDATPFFLTANKNVQSTKTYSVFGQIDWTLAEKWNLTTGARWVKDKKNINITTSCSDVPPDGICGPSIAGPGIAAPGTVQGDGFNDNNAGGLNHKSFSDAAVKLELDYRPYDGLMYYLSANRGIKGGGYNAAAIGGIPLSLVSYKPEILTAYELGTKWTFWDSRARVNGSVFYYDYKNYQAFTLTGVSPFVFNTDATTKGGELELTLVPAKGLNLSFGAAYLDAIAKDVPVNIDDPESARDQRPPQSPKWTLNASIRQEWTLGSAGTLAAQLTGNYVASRYFNTVNHPELSDGSYVVENFRLSYTTSDEVWETALYVNNLSNEKYASTAFDLSGTNGTVVRAYAPPRQAGASVKVRFGK